MRLPARRAHQGIEHHLQPCHAETDNEQAGDDDCIDRPKADREAAREIQGKGGQQRGARSARLDQRARRDRDQPIGKKERGRQNAREGLAQVKVADDGRHQRTDEVGHE
jgi:hypothetical protein